MSSHPKIDQDTPGEMPKAYDPQATETLLYPWWESQGYFKPVNDPNLPDHDPNWPTFVISMPPPNVTGELHLGHALTASLEDLMIRYHRMKGDSTLWVPGTDHAGIATQNVVEKQLVKEGLTRHDIGREQFVARVWQWKDRSHRRITDQHRRLGISCDWDRERFTMDEGLSRAVRTAFVQLYDKGLIYRGTYLVNWCPRCESVISDLEVVYWEEQGHLWTVRYPLVSDSWAGPGAPWGSGHWAEGATEWVSVATTRPETILGDTAVAVNPSDERYQQVVGRTAILPALGRPIPIIADEAVDPAFGTGAVKVTPAHDPNDYAIGQRHHLPMIDVMTLQAKMNQDAGPDYAGLDRYVARERLVRDLEREGLLLDVQDHRHEIGHCQRCDTVVEPRLSTQWFVKMKPLAEPAIAAVQEGRTQIVPERFDKIYFNWMENIRDWVISRQLWWGHRIPVWYCDHCGGLTVAVTDPSRCAHCASTAMHQDEDVLDTWFSSGLWPFSTLGWPEQTSDIKYFYPTTVMETGYDILFFWVARMMMLGLEMTRQEPFRTIYLHGLIRDQHGQKMSKSKGNVIDPLQLVDQYGADALRFYLVTSSSPGADIKINPQRIEGARNFANKIWNAARFVHGFLAKESGLGDWRAEIGSGALADRWLLSRHNRLIADVTRLTEDWQFGEAGRQIYDFLWGEYCDWAVEMAKPRLSGADTRDREAALRTLRYVLERSLRLLHPFMPFVTEAIWQRVGRTDGGPASIMIARWPEAGPVDEAAEADMAVVMDVIRAIREARSEYDVRPERRIAALIVAGPHIEVIQAQQEAIISLARLDPAQVQIVKTLEAQPKQAVTLVTPGAEVYLPLAGMVDLEAERARLSKDKADVDRQIARLHSLLSNPGFTGKAPAEVVEREQAKLSELTATSKRLETRLAALS